MKKLKLLINSRTSGKFTRETIDGRPHLVTVMMPIRGDTAMNSVFYSDKDVESSFMQLNMLPAPSGHPSVNGISVLASHPVANNKQNIGGYLRNPRKKGKRVFVDFMLDEEIANNSKDGKETLRRIEEGEKIGVSTGLSIAQVINKTGSDDFGEKYTRKGTGYTFDHVAILLNETAAGEHAGTELITNSDECEVMHYNAEWAINELSTSDLHEAINKLIRSVSNDVYAWVQDVYPESKSFIFSVEQKGAQRKRFKQSYAIDQTDKVSMLDDKIEVIENPIKYIPKKTTNNKEVCNMDKTKLVLAIIGNTANKFTIKDNERLNAMSDAELNSIVATNSLDEAQAKDYLTTNSKIDFAGYAQYEENKVNFDLFVANKAAETKKITDNIVTNSEYTNEMLKGKSEAELTVITNMLTPEKVAFRIAEQGETLQTNSTKNVVDYTA